MFTDDRQDFDSFIDLSIYSVICSDVMRYITKAVTHEEWQAI